MSGNGGLRLTKRITSCKGQPPTLETGDVVKYEIQLVNLSPDTHTGTLTDSIPEWVGSVTWEDALGETGDENEISVDITLKPYEMYEVNVCVTIGETDPCKGKTFTNYAEFTPEGGCVKPLRAKSDTCVIGCEPLRFDPRVQRMDDRRALSILFDWDEVDWCRFIDAVNCDEVFIPGGPDDPGDDHEHEPSELDKEAVIACLNALGKEGLGKIIQGETLTLADF